MGIDSPWVVEHPEWFVSLDHSPFPSYRFDGEDISSDPRVGIYLEDHYYDRSDAAVVFKWVDRRSGAVRYIYHGNDGTRMPWNDTAQLNYLRRRCPRSGRPDHPGRGQEIPHHPLRRGHDPDPQALPAPLVPAARQRGRHPVAGRAGHSRQEQLRPGHARGVLARGRRPHGQGESRHAAAGRGLLADGVVFRAHAWACTASTTAPS